MNKNYNFERKKLNLPEYGRNILQMVDFLKTIEDRALRNKQAQVIIDVMGNINTHLRDTDDLKHKLWDHLFIISDFTLDVDSPYPIPSPDSITPRPNKINYPKGRIARKHYGRNVENILKALTGIKDEEARREVINCIAKYMRNKSHEYNQEHPSNDVVINDIRAMSNNMIEINDHILDNSKSEFKPQLTPGRTMGTKSGFKKPMNGGKPNFIKPGSVQRNLKQHVKPKSRP